MCGKYYLRQSYHIQWGQKERITKFPCCEWVIFSNKETFDVDHKKRTFARNLKHKAVDQQVSRHRSKELCDEFKNSRQFSLVVSTEGRKTRLKSISLGICCQWGRRRRFWIGLLCWWNEVFRNSDSFHLISYTHMAFISKITSWPQTVTPHLAIASILNSRKERKK